MAEGGLSVLVLGESGRGNERTKDRGAFELLILSENLRWGTLLYISWEITLEEGIFTY